MLASPHCTVLLDGLFRDQGALVNHDVARLVIVVNDTRVVDILGNSNGLLDDAVPFVLRDCTLLLSLLVGTQIAKVEALNIFYQKSSNGERILFIVGVLIRKNRTGQRNLAARIMRPSQATLPAPCGCRIMSLGRAKSCYGPVFALRARAAAAAMSPCSSGW